MNYFSQLLESYDKLKKRALSIKLEESVASPYQTLVKLQPEDAQEVDNTLVSMFGATEPSQTLTIGSIPPAPDKESVAVGTVGLITDAEGKQYAFFNTGNPSTSRPIINTSGGVNVHKFKEFRNVLAIKYLKEVPDAEKRNKEEERNFRRS